jgi:hypothetical protein
MSTADPALLEQQLNHADRTHRLHALRELKRLADAGRVKAEPERPWVNMHCHTTFSYNAHGFSPSRVAWEMYRRGLTAAGTVDFDVLDAVEEALAASDALGFRFTAGIETRVYVPDMPKEVFSSPNEPGVAYYMGQGFVSLPPAGSAAARTLARMAESARARNLGVVERVNRHLADVTIDYAADVLPLTPAGNATERHMLQAYDLKAQRVFPDAARRAQFWAAKLAMAAAEVQRMMPDTVAFRNTLRTKLMKYGSPGYVTPEPSSFPPLKEAAAMVLACGAIPMYAWLDGTSSGEADAELLLDFFAGEAGYGLNIVPDRNWNLRDAAERARKVEKLNEIVAKARERCVPISVGTEINNAVQPMVDHFDSPELRPHARTFLDGALILWGHSLLLRHGGFGYNSAQAHAAFGRDAAARNAFFREAGARAVPHGNALQTLRSASRGGDPKAVLRALGT